MFDTLVVFLKEKISRRQESMKNYPVGKELKLFEKLETCAIGLNEIVAMRCSYLWTKRKLKLKFDTGHMHQHYIL